MNVENVYEKLVAAGISYVSFRIRSSSEIQAYLQKKLKKFHVSDTSVILQVMDRLTALQYINDKKFADTFIESRLRSRPKSIRTIAYELSQRGISEDIITRSLDTFRVQGTDVELARKAINRKSRAWSHLTGIKRKKAIGDFLRRRGFDFDTIRAIIDEMS